jgi:acetyl-CoA carboxylase carboxyl transferase subunit alpha
VTASTPPLSLNEAEQTAIAAVELARHPDRPRALRVIELAFDEWVELRGDRLFGDDAAVVGGTARIGDRWVMVVAQEKGVDALTRAHRNFGMPHPEGYRKAMRLMRMAERFGMPLVCLVDTPAAHPGVGAEERGQAWAIAESLRVMLDLRVPTVSAILSEGGSGGALALAVADRVLALENAVYAVAPPETVAAILYRDAGQRARAAAAQRPTVRTAADLGIVDELVPEPPPGAHAHPTIVVAALRGAILRALGELGRMDPEERLARRVERARTAGEPTPS